MEVLITEGIGDLQWMEKKGEKKKTQVKKQQRGNQELSKEIAYWKEIYHCCKWKKKKK